MFWESRRIHSATFLDYPNVLWQSVSGWLHQSQVGQYDYHSLIIMSLQVLLPRVALPIALGVFTSVSIRRGLRDLEAFLEWRELSCHLLGLGSATLA